MNIIDAGLTFRKQLVKRASTQYIILHHIDAKTATVQDIHRWHLERDNQTWAGIGYNIYVRKDGSVYKGRGVEMSGAHTENYNSISVGVAFEGDYELIDKSMPEAQYNAGLEVIEYLKELYPNAKIVGHKELNKTSCPGSNFPLSDLKEMKSHIVEQPVQEHWAEPIFKELLTMGVALDVRRFDDNITRGEAFALAYKIMKALGK